MCDSVPYGLRWRGQNVAVIITSDPGLDVPGEVCVTDALFWLQMRVGSLLLRRRIYVCQYLVMTPSSRSAKAGDTTVAGSGSKSTHVG